MIKAEVNFSKKLREWDGFGFNYVETCQTPDYTTNPQDYGGFSTLSEEKRKEIIDLIFSKDGLKPGVIKMFFGPFHQREENKNPDDIEAINLDNYDHRTTTQWMRYFVREGLKKTRARGGDLGIITTLYGPPAWMTKQKFIRGRDLDPAYKLELAKYYTSWAKYLKEVEGFPVKYICLHNEGEDFVRWPEDGSEAWLDHGHDYNMYWRPELVVEFLKLLRPVLDAQGMQDVGIACGETTNWLRFYDWGYADAIAEDEDALKSLGVISSHGFVTYGDNRWFADTRSAGIDVIREKRPELHAWTTSISWSKMDINFLNAFRNNIYSAKVNSVIPWAGIQWSNKWVGGDPNPGTAFRVDGNGGYTVEAGYYFYKQLCCAGQPGMAVATVASNDTELGFLGFTSNGTENPDSFVILNTSKEDKKVDITIKGTSAACFEAFRTSASESYAALGNFEVKDGIITYIATAGSATTFYAK
jgi:hypothetical protein